ncbi:MAG TPA: DUF1223 domain-containing protein [Xanthobacteraceae bacterium]|nr:DUF1223 domain-containing protein [Xanthobacteraceae bacterium]
MQSIVAGPAWALAVLAFAASITHTAAETLGVVELFTSQGCSSCPPADKLAGELARDPSLLVMSLPVDYWDYLGWKDTLALPRHTARQRAYARHRGDREVYTPQVVVNGSVHVLGSDKSAIERAVSQTRQQTNTLSLPIKMAVSDSKITISIQPVNADKAALNGEVWLCALTKSVPINIQRGENQGHTITYHNVVRRWIKLGDWDGTNRNFSVPTAELAETVDTAAVLVQSGTPDNPGRILGAAETSLR